MQRRIHLAARVARFVEGGFDGFVHLRVVRLGQTLAEHRQRRYWASAACCCARVPVHVEDLGMPLHDVRGGHLERMRIGVAGDEIARERLDLLLRAGHGQADLLLRPRDVTVKRVFLLLLFAPVQAPQNQTHDDQEHQDRQERREQIGVGPPRSVVPAGGRRRIRRRTGGARRACEKPFGQHAWHCSAA